MPFRLSVLENSDLVVESPINHSQAFGRMFVIRCLQQLMENGVWNFGAGTEIW